MKKLLGIVVLGLLLVGCASGPPIPFQYGGGDGNVVEKNEDFIKIGITLLDDVWNGRRLENSERFENNKSIASSHCASHDKFAFDVDNSMYDDVPYKYLCRKSPKSVNIKNSAGNKVSIDWTNFDVSSDLNIKNMVREVKSYCTQLGLNPGTENYADCSIKLLASKIESQKQIIQQVSSGMSGTVTINDPQRDYDAAIKRGQGLINGTCTLADLSTC